MAKAALKERRQRLERLADITYIRIRMGFVYLAAILGDEVRRYVWVS